MLIEEGIFIVLGAILLSSEGRSLGDAAAVNFPNQGTIYQEYGEQQEYSEQQGDVDRQARDIQENGMESYQPQKGNVRDVRDSAAEESNPNASDAAYQSRGNSDDDIDQQPMKSEMGGNRLVDDRGLKKEVEVVDNDANEQRDMAEQRDVAEPRDLIDQQRDEGVRQETIIDQAEGGGGDSTNIRSPRENGANQEMKEVARTEVVKGNADEVSYEGAQGAQVQTGSHQNSEAAYNVAEQEHNYNNYNYVQDPEGAEGESQQGVAANEENIGNIPAQYEQAAVN